MIIVTAADSHYFTGLINFVGSVHNWSIDTSILIYDLGLTDRQREEIRKWKNISLVRNFFRAGVHDHCRRLRQYAWKPVALHHAIEFNESILWIDAGSDLRSPLEPVMERLYGDGHFFVQGQDLDMTKLSLEGTYTSLNTSKEAFVGHPHFSGGLQGYVRNSPSHEKILKPLYHHALDENCIAPSGSNLRNHRYDQTLLSILIYQSGIKVSPQTQWLTSERSQCNKDPMQKSRAIVYTARSSSIDYIHSIVNKKDELCYTVTC